MNVIKLSENVSVISAPTNVGVIALQEQGKTTIYLIAMQYWSGFSEKCVDLDCFFGYNGSA